MDLSGAIEILDPGSLYFRGLFILRLPALIRRMG
jgi:hypothetical protein